MHRQGYKLSMQVGHTTLAGLNLCYAIHREIISGTNLQTVMTEIEFYLKLAKQHSLSALGGVLQIYYMNVLALMNKEFACSEPNISGPQYEEIENVQEMMFQLFRGHVDRVIYLTKKWEVLSEKNKVKVPIRAISVTFYHGLATTRIYRTRGFKVKHPLENIQKDSLPVLQKAEEFSPWNFKNKVR